MVITLYWVIMYLKRLSGRVHYGLVKIVPFQASHLDGIVLLEQRAFPVGPYTRRMLEHVFRNPQAFSLVAVDDESVAGYVVALPLGDQSADIESIAVDPDYQGKGTGGLLLDAIEREMSSRGFVNSVLEVRDRNIQAINFYRKHGYEITEHMPKYYHELYEGSRGAYRMIKDLKKN